MHRARFIAVGVAVAALVGCGRNGVGAVTEQQRPGDQDTQPTVDGRVVHARSDSIDRSTLRSVPGELLVRFRSAASRTTQALVLDRGGVDAVGRYRTVPGLARVRVRPGQTTRRAMAALTRNREVLYAEPNWVRRVAATPGDPLFGLQWALDNTGQMGGIAGDDLHASEAWDLTTGGRDAVVAVLDTGVDTTHPDLVANLWSNPLDCDGDGIDDDGNGYADDCHGVNVLTGTGDPADDEGHGTHVAGIIGAVGDNGVGVTGVNWAGSIVACKWMGADGEGSDADAIACLDYVAALKDRGVNVVATNNSWGGLLPSRAIEDAIAGQLQRGILFVAAAGNEGGDNDAYLTSPCSSGLPNVICVGASNASDIMTDASNFGRHTVHLMAPGEDVVSTYPTGIAGFDGYAYASGTSMAAPFVTGAVAMYHALHPGADWRAVKNRVLASGVETPTNPYHGGPTITGRRLDLLGMLTCGTGTGVTARLRPFGPSTIPYAWSPVGVPLELAALNIDCSGPRGEVVVTAGLAGEPAQDVVLHDLGAGPDRVAGDGVYTAAWVPPGPGQYTLTFPGDDQVRVIVDPDLEPGFPASMWHLDGTFLGGPGLNTLVGDIDGDAGLEIVVSALASGPLYAFNPDGSAVSGWPVLEGGSAVAYPTLAKLREDEAGEQVVAIYFGGTLAAYDGAGQMLPGWPIAEFEHMWWYYFLGPALAADVDGDGLDEVFAAMGFNADGQRIAENGGPGTGYRVSALIDLDGHGDLAMVGPGEYTSLGTLLNLWRMDGTSVSGFPVTFSGCGATYPAVGDVDDDGNPEIVLVAGTGVLIYGADGVLKRQIRPSGDLSFGAAPALADLDGDGTPDIVVRTDTTMEVFRGDGTTLAGWPVSLARELSIPGSPVVGDVDGDGAPEVVVTAVPAGVGFLGLSVFNPDGRELPGFPKRITPFASGITPAVADIDRDGRNEIVVTSADAGPTGQYGTLYAFDLGGPPHGAVPWGQFMADAHHTGNVSTITVAPRTFHRLTLDAVQLGSVTSSPWGIRCGTMCTRKYLAGTSVVLTAAPDAGYELSGWTGDCTGTNATCTVLMDDDRSVAAQFQRIRRRLTVSRTGAGGGAVSSSPAGIDCGSTCSAVFDGGTAVTLTATPDASSTFAGWSGGGCSGDQGCSIDVNSDTEVTARFIPRQQRINVALEPTGFDGVVTSTPSGLTCVGELCTGTFDEGTVVVLTAVPASGYRFVRWSGDCSGTDVVCHLTASATRNATAWFELIPRFTVAVTREGNGWGVVSSSPAGISCAPSCNASFLDGTVVTLTASPSPGSVFAGWTGDCAGMSVTCQVTASAARSVTARFDLQPVARHTLTVVTSGRGSGLVTSTPPGISCGSTCSAELDDGTVGLGAHPAADSIFAGWSGACEGSGACELALHEDASVTATFDLRDDGGGQGGGGGGGCSAGGHVSVLSLVLLLGLWRRRFRGA